MKIYVKLLPCIFASLSSIATVAHASVEYRVASKSGKEFKWSDGRVEKLELAPFLSGSDFGKASVLDVGFQEPGKFIVMLALSTAGIKKFAAVEKQAREREYCLLVNSVIFAHSEFVPSSIGPRGSESGSSIPGLRSKSEAERLADQINGSLK